MKKLFCTALAVCMLAAVFATVTVAGAATASTETYHLVDKFGAAPNARSFSEGMETIKLNDVQAPYSEYGLGAHLKSTSTGREYIEYDVDGVVEAEVSAIVSESVFGAHHGWGVSLGVAENAADSAVNNINNINLNMVYPIYLSEDGKPFLNYQNDWWAYIAEPKYSFIPSASSSNPDNNLRAFTVPDEVQGVVAEDGFTILTPGYLYPMINLEYCTEGSEEWTPMSLDSSRYAITAAEYITGGDKDYAVTVRITDIPEDAVKVRIGADYIRQSLKPSSEGDIDPDVYVSFPRSVEESLFVTKVNLTLDTAYEGGFEELTQTGIQADVSGVTRYFAYGEQFNADGLVMYDVYQNDIREKNNDLSLFTVDASAFDPYKAGTYAIKINKGSYATSYNVRVEEPERLSLDVGNVICTLQKGEEFSADGLVVKATTKLPGGGEKDVVLPASAYSVDTSALNAEKAGTYAVTVRVGEGENALSATFDVVVEGGGKTGLIVGVAVGAAAVVAAVATGVCLLIRKNKKKEQ